MESKNSSKNGEKRPGFLKIICGPNLGKIYELRGSEVIIGRIPTVDVQVNSRSVSRMHCKLIYSSGKWSVIDMGSQNGTYVNNKNAKSCVSVPLNEKDIIYLGPPMKGSESLCYYDCDPREVHVFAHSSTSFPRGMHSRNTNEKENVLNDGLSSSSLSSNVSRKRKKPEKKNIFKSKPRKRMRIVEPAAVWSCLEDQQNSEFSETYNDSCSEDLEQNDDFSTNEHKCFPSDRSLLDISTSSVESLRTRISKSANEKMKKKKNACSLNKDSESEKSFCDNADKTVKSESFNSAKNLPTTVKCVLDEVFLEDDNSQSLLTTEGDLLIGSDPYPFSQPIASNPDTQLPNPNSDSEDDFEPIISRKSTELILKSQIKLLQEKVQKLEETHSDLKREIAQKAKLIENHHAKEMKQEQDFRELEHTVKEEIKSEIMKRIDEELLCNICTEILIKATVLECSHTFCEHCIYEWKKKKKQCPICRTAITSESKVLILDNFIDKILDFVSPSAKEKRKEIVDKREQLKLSNANCRGNGSRRGRGRGRRRIYHGASTSRYSPEPHAEVISLGNVNPEGVRVVSVDDLTEMMPGEDSSAIDTLMDVLSHTLHEINTLSSQSSSVEGYGYYPGYGRCFNCGRTGHWANGCPENI